MEIEVTDRVLAKIAAFEKKFGQSHVDFACHAALPLALTPDLLYCLWANFSQDIYGKALNIPWIAISDLILSSLCEDVGDELYEMLPAVRQALLDRLTQDDRFTTQRQREVASFLLAYVRQDLNSPDPYQRDFAESQSWAALAYKEPKISVQKLAAAIERTDQENLADLIRLDYVTEMVKQPIPEFERLSILARAMGHYARNQIDEAKGEIIKLSIQGRLVYLGNNIVVSIPQQLVNATEVVDPVSDKILREQISLVQSLLTVRGQSKVAGTILQNNQYLMTESLVQTIKQVATLISGEGNEETSHWLGDLAAKISENIAETSPYIELLIELLQAIVDSNSNDQVIYPILRQNIDKLNEQFAEEMWSWAEKSLPDIDKETAESIASAIGNLSNSIQNFPLGSKAENLDIVIRGYKIGLEVFERETSPESWANFQNNLGTVYSDRIKGSRAENIEQAIYYYQAALTVRTRENFPEDWAMTQNNLATAYINRIKGSRAENIEQAIYYYQAALTVYTLEGFPENWAMAQNNIATFYSNRINGSRAENLERAIEYYQAALTVYTLEGFPENWAMTQNNLANAYNQRIHGSRAENLEMAIECYQLTLTVYTREYFPENWAMTQNNIAAAYGNRINGSRAENLERAILCYRSALTIRTRRALPIDHLETLSNLGRLYQEEQQWQDAYDTFAAAIDTVELLRGEESTDDNRQKLAEEWNKIYLGMVEVCIALELYAEAVEYAERSKGQNLIELLLVKNLYPKGEISPQVRQELQNLKDRIYEEDQRLKQAPEKNYELITQLRQQYATLYPYTSLKLSQIQNQIDHETAIVEWYILEQEFVTFIITNDQLSVWRSSKLDLDLFMDFSTSYLNSYYENREKWQEELGNSLYQLSKILHLNELLKIIPENCQRLCLIPHRYLHLFPIHGLPIQTDVSETQSLLEIFSIGVQYAPSLQVLQHTTNLAQPDFTNLFVIENPTEDILDLDMESNFIKLHFPSSKVLRGSRATKESVINSTQLSLTHCLHIATHSMFDLRSPLDSAIVLSDGNLTISDILQMNFSQCRLVTLSACETGIVDVSSSSDEFISIDLAFLYAGAKNIIGSLWSVSHISTVILMIKFYENLFQGLTISSALSLAQIWLKNVSVDELKLWLSQLTLDHESLPELQKLIDSFARLEEDWYPFSNPFYWAGFKLTGAIE